VIYEEAQRYWIWLSSIQGIGISNFHMLMQEYGEARYVWEQQVLAKRILKSGAYAKLKQACTDEYIDALFSNMEKEGITAVTLLDAEYPERLRRIDHAPPTLYVRGSLELNDEKMFAIVGSRKITADGLHFTRQIARDLAERGVNIVSGLALGADGQAHSGCLDGGGRTIAVLASGPEHIYPSEHRRLAERILMSGGSILSEYPPGVRPDAKNFPQRNRIISGMSDGVLMTEGAVDSGAMITVRYAREQCRPCFAVPGSVYSSASAGPNRMLLEGAQITLSYKQVIDYLGWSERSTTSLEAQPEESEEIELSEAEQEAVDILRFEEKSFDELCILMKKSSAELNSLLTILEMRGIIRQSAGKMYRALV